MSIFDAGLTAEDLYDIHSPIRLGEKRLSNDDVSNSMNTKITFSFYNTDISQTKYGFNQKMNGTDSRRLFKLLKRFSGSTLNELINEKDRKDDEGEILHLNRNGITGNLKSVFKEMGLTVDEGNSTIFHFALYTAGNGNASREKGIKSPRVYFMIGQFGIMHILFFDPYHEINP